MMRRHFNNTLKGIVFSAIFSLAGQSHAGTSDRFFQAAKSDDESAIVALTLRSFDLNIVDEHGETALLIAVRSGSDKVVDFLLKQPSVKVEARNSSGESPLMLAALQGKLEIATRLIQSKAEVNKTRWTPLHYACSNPKPSSEAMVRLLLEHHAYIDAESPNKSTPLMMAAKYGHASLIGLLLEEGADPTLRNEQGLTAVDFARQVGRDEQANLIAAAIRAQNAKIPATR
jgi:ankyrin repeat protein